MAGKEFYIITDRYNGWLSICRAGSDGDKGFLKTLKEYFSTFGIAQQVNSDSGTQFTCHATQEFFRDWGVKHRISLTYFPHTNQRVKQGVKLVKRMLQDNIGGDGLLDTDRFLRALLLHRNTPDRDTGLSPAQVIFGRATGNFFPVKPGNRHPEWRITMVRHARREKDLSEHTRELLPLQVGHAFLVQNQTG